MEKISGKNILKQLTVCAVILLLTVVIELLFFNGHAVFRGRYSHDYFAENNGESFIERKETEEEIIFSLQVCEEYVDKIYLLYSSGMDFHYEIVLVTKDREQSEECIEDQAFSMFGQAVSNIKGSPDQIVIKIDKSDMQENTMPVIQSIRLDNEIHISHYRLLFLFSVLFLVYVILYMRGWLSEHLEVAFFGVVMCMGSLMIILSPNTLTSWDEQIHLDRAYRVSFNKDIEYSQSMQQMVELQIPLVNTAEEKIMLAEYLQEQGGKIVTIKEKQTDLIRFDRLAYLPQAVGLKIGRATGISFQKILWVGKFLNLFTYALILSIAVKYTKIGKKALICVGTIPTAVFLASAYSYDAFITSFLLLGFVMILNELLDKSQELNWKRVAVGVFALLIGCFSKAVYVPLLLLLCFLPKEKFKSRKQRMYFIVAVIFIFLIMMSSFALPALTNTVGNIDVGADPRGGDTSVTRQMKYIFEKPLTYTALLFENIVDSFGGYFLDGGSRTFFSYLGGSSTNLYYLHMLLAIVVTLTGENKIMLDRKLKVVLGILVIGVLMLIWTALYLSFTPVGADTINGVQPRYYIPLMFPVMLLFISNKIECRMCELLYDKIVLLINLFVLCGCIYQIILLPYNI